MAVDAETVAGMKEAQAAFRALPTIARDAFNEATEKTLDAIKQDAEANLRANRSVMTGTLVSHIGRSVNKATGQGKVGITAGSFTVRTQANFMAGEIGGRKVRVKGVVVGNRLVRPTKYGHLVEFGHGSAAPKAFMVPAARSNTDYFLAQCRAAGTEIERDMAKVGGRFL